jgi:hypothetical protein
MGQHRLRFALSMAITLTAAACAGRPSVGASTWPPPCAGSRILEVTNYGSQTYEVVWGDEMLGMATPSVSRLPVAIFSIVDARIVGGPLFRVRGSRGGFGPANDVRYRLLCE